MSELARVRAIVMGSSAGGVEAVGAILQGLPPGFVPSILVVLHLPADHPSRLAQLFGGRCQLPVREALDKEPVEPGTVYVAPPNYHLLVEPGETLALSNDPPVRFSRPSIDVLFESAAACYRDQLLAVLLTGANDDGAEGLAAVRAEGGRAWVQDPADAHASEMPQAALRRSGADLVVPLADIAERLAHLRTGRLTVL